MKSGDRLPAALPIDRGQLRFALLLACAFLALAGIGAIRHELWRDEMQAWLVARDEPDLRGVIEQSHYEGSPPLWTLMLRPLTLATHRPEAMQALTWIIAGATVFLIAGFAPFGRLQRALLVGNYYLLFEYGIVCRNYLPGIFLLVAAMALMPSSRERPWLFAAALAGAALASVHSLIVAVAVAAAFAVRCRAAPAGGGKRGASAPGMPPVLPLLAVAAGVGLAIAAVLPRPDTLYPQASGWNLDWNVDRLAKVSCAFVRSYFPSPSPPGFFWIPPWDRPPPSFDHGWALALAVALFGGSILLLRRHAAALILYLVGTLGIAAFLYLRYLGFYRHAGFLFLAFLFALWLKKSGGPGRDPGFRGWLDRTGEIVFTVALVVQAATGLWALQQDFTRPFSCGKQAARYLTDHRLGNAFIAVGPDWAGSPLAGYLDRSVYYPAASRFGSFTRWDTRRTEDLDDEEFLRRAAREAQGAEIIVALDRAWPQAFLRSHQIESLAELHGSLTPFEDYFLYRVPGRAAGR